MLRDRLVCGNKDVLDLQYQNKASADVHAKQSMQTVLKFEERNKWMHKQPRTNFYRCGGDHKQHECRFLQEQCRKCAEFDCPPPSLSLRGWGEYKQQSGTDKHR